MTDGHAELQSGELSILLRVLPPEASDQVAALVLTVRARARLAFEDSELRRSLEVRNLRGHFLVPDIERELLWLARQPPMPAPSYREMLQTVAHRHEVEDDGKRAPASVERDLLRRYVDNLRPDPKTFEDRGSSPLLQRVGFFVPGPGWVAWAVGPDWRAVTAATLEIAAHRRIALTRLLRSALED